MQILKDQGVDPQLIHYLKTPPDLDTLKDISRKLGLEPKHFIRRNEAVFKELRLKERLDDSEALLQAMASHPRLIERPIAVKGERAVLGRPPERVLELL